MVLNEKISFFLCLCFSNEALGILKLVGEDGLPLRFDSAHAAHGILAQV
jgi:hypothetical protein